jgi:hypothetical protein
VHKLEYFIKAIKAKAFIKNHWVFTCFSITHENADDYKKDPYPYRLIQTPTGFLFIDPENNNDLTPIEGIVKGSPAFTFQDRIELKAKDIDNLDTDIVSTTGNVLFNVICLVNAFGDKVKYINKRITSIRSIEDMIASRIEDTPEEGAVRDPKYIYVDEYIKFVDSVFHLTNFSQLCVWGATEKVITPPPGIAEFKAKVIEKYKDSLTDSTTLARIDKELIEFDAKYLEGDPGLNFLLSSKSRNIVRKKKYLFYGAEPGLTDSVKLQPVLNSLDEGWDLKAFPQLNDALRAGSFNRGAQTELGGVSVKWLLRASSNIVVASKDCGTTMGEDILITPENHKTLIDFSIVTKDGPKLIESEEESGTYIGKVVRMRTPMYCNMELTDYCEVCVGKKLGRNPTGLSLTISEYGSAFLGIFMSAAHAKQLQLQKADLKKIIS